MLCRAIKVTQLTVHSESWNCKDKLKHQSWTNDCVFSSQVFGWEMFLWSKSKQSWCFWSSPLVTTNFHFQLLIAFYLSKQHATIENKTIKNVFEIKLFCFCYHPRYPRTLVPKLTCHFNLLVNCKLLIGWTFNPCS